MKWFADFFVTIFNLLRIFYRNLYYKNYYKIILKFILIRYYKKRHQTLGLIWVELFARDQFKSINYTTLVKLKINSWILWKGVLREKKGAREYIRTI